jgi:hypothetical protein
LFYCHTTTNCQHISLASPSLSHRPPPLVLLLADLATKILTCPPSRPSLLPSALRCSAILLSPSRCALQGFLYVRADKCDNEYAHPLDLCALVDLNLGKVRSWAGTRGGGGVCGWIRRCCCCC